MNKILIDSYFFTLRSQLLQPEQSREKLVRDGKIEVCKIQNGLTYDFLCFWKFLIIVDKLLPPRQYVVVENNS